MVFLLNFQQLIKVQGYNLIIKITFMKLAYLIAIFLAIVCVQNVARKDRTSIEINQPGQPAQLFFNGSIITMTSLPRKHGKSSIKVVKAIAVQDGIITHVGSFKAIQSKLQKQKKDIKYINLENKTLMPGFYDAHSHFGFNAMMITQGFDLSSPPMGNVADIPTIITNIKTHLEIKKPPLEELVFGVGFNDLGLKELRFPTRYQLDKISTDYKICIIHSSMHALACNSKVMDSITIPSAQLQENKTTITFGNGTLTGVLKQLVGMQYIMPMVPKITPERMLQGQKMYLSAGYTTAHDIFETIDDQPSVYNKLGDNLILDMGGYLVIDPNRPTNLSHYKNLQTNHFKVKGIKIILDGSIQAYTAYLTKPYFVQPLGKRNYAGFSAVSNQTTLMQFFLKLYQNQNDTLVHCNGDAAAEQLIEAVEYAKIMSPIKQTNRIVMVHAQTVSDKQLDKMKRLGITPSFFPSHVYFWGYDHLSQLLGPERAARINPAKSALDRKIKFTFHSDAPVTPVMTNGVFRIIWSAVNRIMYEKLKKVGNVLGKDQRISVQEALKAVTINAAWQGQEQKTKGSIKVGKVADLILLDKNPLKVKSFDLINIQVLRTYKNGKVVYEK